MLLIKITESDGSDPVILHGTESREYSKSLNSPDEGLTFEISKNDPKADVVNPYNETSYTRFWEVWETSTNTRLNFGPITSIEDQGQNYRVTGSGRSALLSDHFQTLKTFYGRIDSIVDEIRFENIATSPSTVTLVNNMDEDDTDNAQFFPMANINSKYWNLSKRSKDFAIDDETNYIPLGKIEPPRTFSTTSQYWTGMSHNDALWLDFGDTYQIDKIKVLFPWWGGPQRLSNRTYDFRIRYATDTPTYDFQGRDASEPVELWDSNDQFGENRIVTVPSRPMTWYIGATLSGTGTELNTFYMQPHRTTPLEFRYLQVAIQDVHAWYGTEFDRQPSHDGFDFQCDPYYEPGDDSYFGNTIGTMTYRKNGNLKKRFIPDEVIKPSNDCHASIVEIGAYKQIVEKRSVKPLALQRIDNNNRQITYSRVPDASEMKRHTYDGKVYRKFEPGTFFRKFTIDWASANNTFTKFYKDDCDDCYSAGFSFGVVDDDNSLIYRSDSASGTSSVRGKQNTKHIITRGTSDVEVTLVDAWKGKTDPLSWGGSYSYTEKTGDYFVVHFRGQSFKWYATIPANKTGATVKIEKRIKALGQRQGYGSIAANFWGVWETLEASLTLPNDISNEVVYEIPYGSSELLANRVYEIRITLLDDNYASVDSIEGYWSASFTEYNEDSNRIRLSKPDKFTQIYNKKFSGGSMYKWNTKGASASIQFEGDRIIIASAKGRNHGRIRILLFQAVEGSYEYDPGESNHIYIPGGSANGSLEVDLDTGQVGQEFPNYIAFDSNDYFTDGLPWGKYTALISLQNTDQYTTSKYETGSDTFKYRCQSCDPKTGTQREINKYVYLDSIGVHELVGLSVNFDQESHLNILQSVAEAIQVEWDVSESGLMLEPRLGSDTYIALREGENTLVNFQIANDFSKVATKLLSYGTAIDGIDMFSITEDKRSKRLFGRTITRQNDFRDIGSYQQLIGLSRTELKRRNRPERRITVTHTATNLDLERGDSFVLWTRKAGEIRVRIQNIRISESSSGRVYTMECVEWPQIT